MATLRQRTLVASIGVNDHAIEIGVCCEEDDETMREIKLIQQRSALVRSTAFEFLHLY